MTPHGFAHVPFPDHELLDCGGGEKLERFGDVVVRRPDPQALWPRALAEDEWARRAGLTFLADPESGGRGGAFRGAAPSSWSVRFARATFLLRPTAFKHVGIFPEQSTNWSLVARAVHGFGVEEPRLLNLFGYTGAASVLAAMNGYEVTHVDASKTSLAWARENLAASGMAESAMRVVLDDALAFTRREARRGARYQAVLLDPPHYGRGPKGEKWQFEDSIAALTAAVREVVDDRALVILSSYAIGCSPLTLQNLLADLGAGELESGELALPERSPRGRLLPAGFCARWSRGVELALDDG
jgi:23S rRNA (cytosine1962-C5)-methyltransferase